MEVCTYERRGTTAYISLNRPEARNALSLPLIEALTAHMEAAAADTQVRVVVLGGNGRHFCAGADLLWMQAAAELDEAGNRREAEVLGRLFAVIDASPKAVIADVHGAAVGGGAGLVAVCDYVVARADAFFAFSEVRLGLIPAVIAPFVLTKIGASATRAYFTSGERFSAVRAREIGLVHEVVSESEHQGAIERLVQSYATAAPQAVAAAKDLLRRLVYERPATQREIASLTADAIARRRVGVEARQGIAAFLEGRPAPWL